MSALKLLGMEDKTVVPDLPFPRYTYEELLDLLNTKLNLKIEWGEDLSTEANRKLGQNHFTLCHQKIQNLANHLIYKKVG